MIALPAHHPDAFGLRSARWTIPVLLKLGSGVMRYGVLRQHLGSISNKSLSAALRQLERDGLVDRKVFAQIPPRVDYWLTPLGDDFVRVVAPFVSFLEQQRPAISSARLEYDARRPCWGPTSKDRKRDVATRPSP